jgi:DHA1 family multidrug resistance protein-like MFS transporter
MESKKTEKAIVLGIYGLVLTSIGILLPILPLFLTDLGIDPGELGLLFSVNMVAVAIGEMTWGRVIDKVGVGAALFTGTFFVAGITALFLFLESLPFLFILFFLLGFSRAAIFITGRWYIAVHSHPSERASSMALLVAIMSGTRSVASVIGGAVVDGWGYPPALLAAVIGPLLGGFLLLITRRKLRSVGMDGDRIGHDMGSEIQRPFRHAFIYIVGVQGIIAALNYFGFSLFLTYTSLYSTQVIGTDATSAGLLFSIQGFMNLIVVIPLARIADRRGKKVFMSIGLFGSAIAFLGMALSSTYTFLVISVIVFSLSFALFGPAAVATLSESVPHHRQGTAIGIYGVFEDVGMILGSSFGGILWENWNPFATFLSGSIAAIIGALASIRFIKELPPGENVQVREATNADG